MAFQGPGLFGNAFGNAGGQQANQAQGGIPLWRDAPMGGHPPPVGPDFQGPPPPQMPPPGFNAGPQAGPMGQGVPQIPQMPPPTGNFQQDMANLVHLLGNSMSFSHNSLGALANTMAQQNTPGYSGPPENRGFRSLKRKSDLSFITAGSPKVLMIELYQFELDLGEVGLSPHTEAGFRQLKAQAQDKARSVLDLALAEEPGLTYKRQLDYACMNYAPEATRNQLGSRLYLYCVGKLEDACRLTNAKRVEIAMEIDSEAKMNGDSVAEAELFMERWRKSRFLLLKEGLIPVSPQVVIDQMNNEGNSPEMKDMVFRQLDVAYQKEITRFMDKRVSPSIMEFMYERQPIPRTLDEMLACVDLWVEKQRRSKHGLRDRVNKLEAIAKGLSNVSVLYDGGEQSGYPAICDDPERVAAVQQSCFNMHTDQSAAEAAPTVTHYGSCDVCDNTLVSDLDQQIAALTQQRNAAYLAGGNKRGQPPQRKTFEGLKPPPGTVQCKLCKGYHSDTRGCPTTFAKQDRTFKPTPGAKCGWKVVQGGKTWTCNGEGHFNRHHRQVWQNENPGKTPPCDKLGNKKPEIGRAHV